MTPPSSPKGSLEDLFRHHLLESEAAAVPPLPHVWEQLDNSLLAKENALYRRRLQAYRWAMAASLFLAALAGGGWWRSQFGHAPLAANVTSADDATAGFDYATGRVVGRHPTGLGSAEVANLVVSSSATYSIGKTSTFSGASLTSVLAAARGYATKAQPYSQDLIAAHVRRTRNALASEYSAAREEAGPTPAAALAVTGSAPALTSQLAADQLAGRLANLQLPGSASLPARLFAATPATLGAARPTRPWQLQVAYAAGVFDPNVDFTKAPVDYDANLGPGTVATTRDAAAEYRRHLRPGLSQRLGVWATRRLGIGRWNLRTGLEITQNKASSSSSVAFVGEQVATLNPQVQVQSNHLQTTTYRYRSVGVPVELSYASPLRHGFSLYGHVGTLFSALLNVRSDVAGEPEATRIYSYSSASSPYRQLSTTLRSGVGMRYQPTQRQWALNLGPVAEVGVLSLNSDPTQDFWNQRRPYSIGLEAGLEFSSLLKPAPALIP